MLNRRAVPRIYIFLNCILLFLLRMLEKNGSDWGGHPELSCKICVSVRPLLIQFISLSLKLGYLNDT